MFWLKKRALKKMLDELEKNVAGMRKMSNAYKTQGGFLEVANIIAKEGAEGIVPTDLMEEGRRAEEEFAEVCGRLADCYQKLLNIIKERVGMKR